MVGYRYTIGNSTTETLDINLIPKGIEFETIEIDEVVEIEDDFELKQKAHQQLLQTDWYVTRFVETGKPIPSDILELRNKIRNNGTNSTD